MILAFQDLWPFQSLFPGALLLGIGLALHEIDVCPCVKRIWTPSWTLYSGGWCFLLLAGFYAIIDAGHISSWSFPLRVIGANSIAARSEEHTSELQSR